MAILELDRDAWTRDRGNLPFLIKHDYHLDPRLTHDRVSSLAGSLPAESVEMNLATLDVLHSVDGSEEFDLPPEHIARNVVALKRWMSIEHIEQDPEYKDLLDAGLDAVADGLGLGDRMVGREGYIFLSASSSVTPAHLDHEHNVFLQIEGVKRVTIGRYSDEREESKVLEGMHSGAYGRTGFIPDDAQTFTLEPGDGVYIPPRGIHAVEVEDSLAVSLSLVFHTKDLLRAARVYAVNAKLRRLGLDPRAPGHSTAIDRLKSGGALAWRRARGVG